jgi:hypothetical protein
MATKTDQFDHHERSELDVKSKIVISKKQAHESCRTCKHFYHRKVPRISYELDRDNNKIRDITHNDTMCGYKNKPVKHYNICEYHIRLVVQLVPLSEYLK